MVSIIIEYYNGWICEDFDPTEKGIYFENNNKNISINGSNQSYNIYPENIQLDNYGNLYFSLSNSHGILYKQVSPEIVVEAGEPRCITITAVSDVR